MNIVTSLVRVLVLAFVVVGGAITFAGPQAIRDTSAQDTLEPATVLNTPARDASTTERSPSDTDALRNTSSQDVG